MTLLDLINKTYDGQKIKVIITSFGMKFTTEHRADYYTDLEEDDRRILEKTVEKMWAENDVLCVRLM